MAKLHNIIKDNGEDAYQDFSAGTVYQVAADALEAACATGKTLTMLFNSARVKVTGKEANGKSVADMYFAECKRQQEEYENSPAGRAAAARWAAQLAAKQKIIDTLVDDKLENAIEHGVAGVIGWFKDYANEADNRFLKRRYDEILPKLKAAGYRKDAHVHDAATENDLRAKGLYIIGQCISCMEGGMPPHPGAAAKFIEEYEKLRKTKMIPVMRPVTLNGKTPPAPETVIPVMQKLKIRTPAG